jgi:hypothetical protein
MRPRVCGFGMEKRCVGEFRADCGESLAVFLVVVGGANQRQLSGYDGAGAQNHDHVRR